MRSQAQLISVAAASLMLSSMASAQSPSPSPSPPSQAKKDYQSLQYGNGTVHPEQQKSIERRSKQLDEAFSDDGTTKPSPSPTPSQGKVRPQ